MIDFVEKTNRQILSDRLANIPKTQKMIQYNIAARKVDVRHSNNKNQGKHKSIRCVGIGTGNRSKHVPKSRRENSFSSSPQAHISRLRPQCKEIS